MSDFGEKEKKTPPEKSEGAADTKHYKLYTSTNLRHFDKPAKFLCLPGCIIGNLNHADSIIQKFTCMETHVFSRGRKCIPAVRQPSFPINNQTFFLQVLLWFLGNIPIEVQPAFSNSDVQLSICARCLDYTPTFVLFSCYQPCIRKLFYPLAQNVPLIKLMALSLMIDIRQSLVIKHKVSGLVIAAWK